MTREQVVAAADKAFGRVDILVNSAGITDRGTIWDTSPSCSTAMFAVNVRAPFFLMQDALKVMKREKIEGSIVNIISMSGHGGQSFITAYCASKGALITLTKNVAYSVMSHRIRVNGLTIGWMDTPGEDRIMKTYHGAEDGWLKEAEKGRPFGRLLKPDEVARAVGFPGKRGERADDRLDHRLRPAGARARAIRLPRRRLASLTLRRRGVPAIDDCQCHRQRQGRRHRAETFEIRLDDLEQHIGRRGDRREHRIGDRDDLGAARALAALVSATVSLA